MRFVTEKYEQRLHNLAEMLRRPVGDAALGDTVEFEPVVIEFPGNARLKDPARPELGWQSPPPPEAA